MRTCMLKPALLLLSLGLLAACGGGGGGGDSSSSSTASTNSSSSASTAASSSSTSTASSSAASSAASSSSSISASASSSSSSRASSSTASSASSYSVTQSTVSNSVDITVENAFSVVDVPYVTVKVCVPGTTTCTTVDHVLVDTGSTGLRILASALDSSVSGALTSVTSSSGSQLGECAQFVSGYMWGTVKKADLYIAGEEAASLPIQLVSDSSYSTVPSACQAKGASMGTQISLGANGIIGLSSAKQDCGSSCVSSTTEGYYYSCTSSTSCTATTVALTSQVLHPAAQFSSDNNGVVLVLPSIASSGAATATGKLYFGIGTQSNNVLGSAVPHGTSSSGLFYVSFNGSSMYGYIDSGSNGLFFNDSSLTTCTSGTASGWFCPTSTTSLSATMTSVATSSLSSSSATLSFSIANAQSLFSSGNAAFSNLGAPYGNNTYFAFGLPFFFGKSVFVAIEGSVTPVGYGPYVAF